MNNNELYNWHKFYKGSKNLRKYGIYTSRTNVTHMLTSMLHSEWSAPLGLPAPVWGILTLIGYLLFWRVGLKR